MLVFTSLDGARVEPCLIYSEYEKTEELNGTMEISFTVPKVADNSAAFSILDYETTIQDEDGHEYTVKQINCTHTRKTATAIHKYFNLSDVFFHDIIGGSTTFGSIVDKLFENTGFTATMPTALRNRTMTVFNFGADTVTALVDELCKLANVERQITSARSIYFAEQIGEAGDLVFRYAGNIKTLAYEVDTTDVKTVIQGTSEFLPKTVVYKSPNVAIFGEREAEPIEDNEIETEQAMIDRLRAEITDEPEVVIEVDVLTLDGNVGDTVLLLHEPLGIDIATRILSKTTQRNYAASSITVGNTTIKSIGDVIADQAEEIKQNKKLTRSRIEQTNDRITLEVEEIDKSIGLLEIRADSITQSVKDLDEKTQSTIKQTAESILAEVETNAGNIAALEMTANEISAEVKTNAGNISQLKITAEGISSTVSGLNSRLNTAESSIKQNASEIELRVKSAEYTGNTIISKINLTSTTATIQASKINLVGAVTVLSDITGDLGTITAGTVKSVNMESVNIKSGTINVSTDVTVGNRIYLGSLYGGGSKAVYFNNSANITAGTGTYGADMAISCDNFKLHGLSAFTCDASTVSFSSASRIYVGSKEAALTRTSGLGFGYSTASKRLYVSMNGSDVGYIELT